MDVRDSPWRPPRERQSEGRGRGEKVLRRIGEKLAQAITLRAFLPPAGPFAEPWLPEPGRDRAFNPPTLLPRLPTPFPAPPPPPPLNVPRLNALCVNTEAPCTQPPREHASAHAHTPVAHVIAHLLLARTTAGARSRTFRSRLLSAVLLPRHAGQPASSPPRGLSPGSRQHLLPPRSGPFCSSPSARRRESAVLRARVSPRISCDPSRESPEARAALGRNRGTNSGRPGSPGKRHECATARDGGEKRGGASLTSPLHL